MAPAAERLREELARVKVAAPRLTVVANIDAAPYPAGAEAQEGLRERLYRQVTGTVRWEASMKALSGLGVRRAVETGPGKVLSGLLKRIDPAIEMFSFGEPAQLDPLRLALLPAKTEGTR
jgi:[acyl-carrier-protein] S-malonyltransferase